MNKTEAQKRVMQALFDDAMEVLGQRGDDYADDEDMYQTAELAGAVADFAVARGLQGVELVMAVMCGVKLARNIVQAGKDRMLGDGALDLMNYAVLWETYILTVKLSGRPLPGQAIHLEPDEIWDYVSGGVRKASDHA